MISNKPNPIDSKFYRRFAKILGQTPKPTSPPTDFAEPTKANNSNPHKK